MSSQILIIKQLFSFSFSTVLSIQLFKPRTCPTTVVPLHVASNIMAICVSRRQTSTSPITLDHYTSLQMLVTDSTVN